MELLETLSAAMLDHRLLVVALQLFAIAVASFVLAPILWPGAPALLGIDRLLAHFGGRRRRFVPPGFIGSLTGLFVYGTLLCRGWLRVPVSPPEWAVAALNVWVVAAFMSLLLGDERRFFAGTLSSYALIASLTGILVGTREVIGYSMLCVVAIGGFNLTNVSWKLGGLSLPFLFAAVGSFLAQNGELLERLVAACRPATGTG
ncbi:MAG: hypothetical protein HYZ53_18640 [Planctomycetes bacterium]|nr:hypothetical protein [Planctomycetota bacterium]